MTGKNGVIDSLSDEGFKRLRSDMFDGVVLKHSTIAMEDSLFSNLIKTSEIVSYNNYGDLEKLPA